MTRNLIVTGDKGFLEFDIDRPECMTATEFLKISSEPGSNQDSENKTMLKTERLHLRKWDISDAESLFKYAKDADVGPIAGWSPHASFDL